MPEFEYVVVSAHLPSRRPMNLGVLLIDTVRDELLYEFRSDLAFDSEQAAVIGGLPDHFRAIAEEQGAAALLRYLHDSLSNTIRITDRLPITAATSAEALSAAYETAVMRTPPR